MQTCTPQITRHSLYIELDIKTESTHKSQYTSVKDCWYHLEDTVAKKIIHIMQYFNKVLTVPRRAYR